MYYKNVLAQMVDDDVIFDDVIRFSEKGMLFLGVLFMTFLFFFLDFAYKLVFFRSVNIRYYLKIWSNGAPNRH